ncbi:helix-turn-helix domain-containing protein, partial [Escherichia coli]|uniref:helix-turn-helix domain-containing protein n=1 Tax=Escherichia coli TaxID=562 RepID=UPI00202BB51D
MKKLIVSSVLAFITFSAQAAAFQVTSNEIKTGEQLFKFQLRPGGQQEREMRRFAGACRFVFNRALARQNENHE